LLAARASSTPHRRRVPRDVRFRAAVSGIAYPLTRRCPILRLSGNIPRGQSITGFDPERAFQLNRQHSRSPVDADVRAPWPQEQGLSFRSMQCACCTRLSLVGGSWVFRPANAAGSGMPLRTSRLLLMLSCINFICTASVSRDWRHMRRAFAAVARATSFSVSASTIRYPLSCAGGSATGLSATDAYGQSRAGDGGQRSR
jgi:hypothetical protein